MSDYVLDQNDDGVWFAAPVDGGSRVDDIAGWAALQHLLDEHQVAWSSPTAISRFRAQFGEPPTGIDLTQMAVGG